MKVLATYAREELAAFNAAAFCARLAREGVMTPLQAEALERGLEDFDVQSLELTRWGKNGSFVCRFSATDLPRMRDSEYVLGVGRQGRLYEARRLDEDQAARPDWGVDRVGEDRL